MSCHQIHKLQRFQQQFQASKSAVARESTVNKCGNVQHQDESYQNKMVETFGTQHEYEERRAEKTVLKCEIVKNIIWD